MCILFILCICIRELVVCILLEYSRLVVGLGLALLSPLAPPATQFKQVSMHSLPAGRISSAASQPTKP